MANCLFDEAIFDPDIFDTCDQEINNAGYLLMHTPTRKLQTDDEEEALLVWYAMEEM